MDGSNDPKHMQLLLIPIYIKSTCSDAVIVIARVCLLGALNRAAQEAQGTAKKAHVNQSGPHQHLSICLSCLYQQKSHYMGQHMYTVCCTSTFVYAASKQASEQTQLTR